MLAAHGMRGTYYINTGDMWGMSWSQIHDLADAGHEIGGHTLDHADLTSLSTAEATRQVCDDRNNLIAQGFTATSFAYPYGRNNASVQQVVRNCGYTSARDVTGGTETIPPAEPVPDPHAGERQRRPHAGRRSRGSSPRPRTAAAVGCSSSSTTSAARAAAATSTPCRPRPSTRCSTGSNHAPRTARS